MFEEKFGMFPKKKVTFEGQTLTINKTLIPIKDIQVIYKRPFNFAKNEWGSLYISTDGGDLHDTELLNDQLIKFSKGQTKRIDELLELLNVNVVEKQNFASTQNIKQDAIINTRVCPKCGSSDIQFMENKKKSFSVGKAIGGTMLTGGIGSVAGFAGKQGKKDVWHCKNCGEIFELKR